VADVLRSLLSGNAAAREREGVETTDEGIYIALTAWQRHGLDTGIVVRALHDSRLLIPDRGQKIRRRRVNGSEELGVLLVTGILV
jgi:hypothetical protein